MNYTGAMSILLLCIWMISCANVNEKMEAIETTTERVPTEGTKESVPSEGTTENVPTEGTTESVPTEGTTESVPTEGTTEETTTDQVTDQIVTESSTPLQSESEETTTPRKIATNAGWGRKFNLKESKAMQNKGPHKTAKPPPGPTTHPPYPTMWKQHIFDSHNKGTKGRAGL